MLESYDIDHERYPTLSDAGRQMLTFLREQKYAPIFRNSAGNRLSENDVARVRAVEDDAAQRIVDWHPGAPPAWLQAHIARCYAEVPHYRALGAAPRKLGDIPAITRADLSRDIASFVPDDIATDRLINFRTSGTTGHPLLIPSHPVVAAAYLGFHKRALRRFGVELRNGRGQVGVALLGYQRQCFTYVSVTPNMNESGFVKINLHENDWRDASDRARYLDALQPELLSGDPISFAALLQVPMTWKPRALLSTSMTLLPALREHLEARFECAVLDVYSMNEAGPLAVFDARARGHVLLQPDMMVEIVNAAGQALPAGEHGEITLTGGFNFCLPLLRYRTGDYASLDFSGAEPVLRNLSGRPPVRFRTASGDWINNIELTHALRELALQQYRARQSADGKLLFEYTAQAVLDEPIAHALHALLGAQLDITIVHKTFDAGKVIQYLSEIPGASGDSAEIGAVHNS